MLKIGVIIISISVNKCCNHDKIAISPIFKMAAAAILDFEKKAIVGAWHHPDLISRGSEDSKTVLTSNTCFFKGVKVKIATIPPDYHSHFLLRWIILNYERIFITHVFRHIYIVFLLIYFQISHVR